MSRFMIYHGCPSPKSVATAREHAPSFRHGVEWNPDKMTPHDEPYLLDNGAFSAHKNATEWDPDPFLQRLDEIPERMPRDPDFVVLPDVLGDAEASIERSWEWQSEIADHGYPYYLPAQDGMSPERAVSEACDMDADGVFIGGSDRFTWQYAKLITDLAHEHGLNAHIGRPGPNLTWARDTGADSVDSVSIIRNGYWHRLQSLEASKDTEQTVIA